MITDAEFRAILDDDSKRIEGDISWKEDEDRSHALEFRVSVNSDSGDPLQINGWYNHFAGKLTFTLIRQGTGRIYGLDIGVTHGRERTGLSAMHKHRWSESRRDKNIYYPSDITAPVNRPVEAWEQFCAEARIDHQGAMHAPGIQGDMGL